MRSRTAFVLTGVALVVVLALAGGAASAGQPKVVRVLCWNNHFPNEGPADIRSSPRKCSLYRDGFDYEAAGAVHMRKLRWKHWGDRTAVGKGQYAEPMDLDDPWKPLRVRLKRPVERCGRVVYSKAKFTDPAANNSIAFPIWTC